MSVSYIQNVIKKQIPQPFISALYCAEDYNVSENLISIKNTTLGNESSI